MGGQSPLADRRGNKICSDTGTHAIVLRNHNTFSFVVHHVARLSKYLHTNRNSQLQSVFFFLSTSIDYQRGDKCKTSKYTDEPKYTDEHCI